MTSLAPLHQRLRRLVRRRRRLRLLAGLTPLVTAVFWFLGVAFLLDWLLLLNRPQRLVLWGVGLSALVWAYRRYGWPWVRGKESELDVALWVERQARVDTDVVAALQFESPEAASWGSVQLEQAVIEQAAQLAPRLPMDEGLPKRPIQRRTVVLAGTVAIVLAVWAIWPVHVETFLARLFLSNRHYPTRTQIQWVKVNGQIIPAEMSECWLIEGQPVRVEVLASGQLPEEGRMELALSSTGARTNVPLQPLSPGEAKGQPPPDSSTDSGLWTKKQPASSVKKQKEPSPPDSALYVGGLDRLSDPAWMKVYLGDAWTEPILLRLTPLPRIELLLEVQPPDYAQEADVPKGRFPGLCQLAVVEGSQVWVHISSDKRLQEASVRIEEKSYPMRLAEAAEQASQPVSASPDKAGAGQTEAGQPQWWTLSPAGTPLQAVTSPLQFTIQVKDEHNLSLEHPVQGFLRILPDLAPRVSASQRTQRILPTARPRIWYEASDDFGIGKVSLVRQVVRADGSTAEDELTVYQLPPGQKPQKTRQATVQVPLHSLQLKPGDQLRLTVRVEDYRGGRPAQVGLSEPLVFQVTDLAGILAAITEADRQLVQEYQEMIDRQLEIGGEKP
ncbi:MAG: hypothetical protein NZ602_01205 [Thermoguttaceae bacterium]|nr:hypothetical protein [Thermoguttaceae bacterium]MDW8037412.1 hypothetical protein [Thermoguttaceae bacterium]